MDTTVMVYGFTRDRGIGGEPPMTWSWENDEDAICSPRSSIRGCSIRWGPFALG